MKKYNLVVKPGRKPLLYPIFWTKCNDKEWGYARHEQTYTLLDPRYIGDTIQNDFKNTLEASYAMYEKHTFDKRKPNTEITKWGVLRDDYFYLSRVKKENIVFVVDTQNECLRYTSMKWFTDHYKQIHNLQRGGELSALNIAELLTL